MCVGLIDQILGSLIESRMILRVEILVVTEGIAGNLYERFLEKDWGFQIGDLYCLCKRTKWKEKVIQY